MDISQTIEPDSSQINADDLVSGPIIVTVTDVSKVQDNGKQRLNIAVAEFPTRAYRPSKTMGRLIAAAWGTDSREFIGKRLELYRDPNITFGKDKVGGIRISAMSGIEKPVTVALQVSRGRRQTFTVKPLAEMAPTVTPELINAATNAEELRAMWFQTKDPALQEQINARAAQLTGEVQG